MRKTYLLYLTFIKPIKFALFVFATLLISSKVVSADTLIADSQSWTCLEPVRCNTGRCSGKGDTVHRAALLMPEGVRALPSRESYIVMCMQTLDGQVCTTGDDAVDVLLLKNGNASALATDQNVKMDFRGLFKSDGVTKVNYQTESITTDANGRLDIEGAPFEWDDYTPASLTRSFLLFQAFEATTSYQSGVEGGQQQATFDVISSTGDCSTVRWDPYGRVFDSQSLEPIPGARVTLSQKNLATSAFTRVSLPGLINPQTTLSDGLFNFVVPDGTYKLEAAASGYSYPGNLNLINLAYSNIYSNIYPQTGPTGELSYDIVQQGAIEQRDIPLDPIDGVGKQYPVSLLEYHYERASNLSSRVFIKGRVSHGFTTVKAYSILSTESANEDPTPKTMLFETTSDREGFFKVEADQAMIPIGEVFGVIVLEKSTTSNTRSSVFESIVSKIISFIVKPVEAQTTTSSTTMIGFNPLLTYVEGYAYDSNGSVLPNATVSVFLKNTEIPYYETKANPEGFFKISSNNLPTSEFILEYTSATGTKFSVTTSDFVAQNAQYGDGTTSVDYYSYRDASGQVITVTPPPIMNDITTDPSDSTGVAETSGSSTILLVIIVILLLLGISGIILGVYLLKKKETEL